jgi:hypothetical protein
MHSSTNATKAHSPSQEQEERVASKIAEVQSRIGKACEQARRTDRPRLVAVSKLHPPSSIYTAHTHAKQDHFGENYAQELIAKAQVLPSSIKWHFVGKLQSNKAKGVGAIPNLFLVETVDSIKLANALEKARAAIEAPAKLSVYLQINTSAEENKAGLQPLHGDDEGKNADAEVTQLASHIITECNHLQLTGLMSIGAASNSRQDADELKNAGGDAERISRRARQMNPDFESLHGTRTRLVRSLRSMLTSRASEEVKQKYTSLLSSDADPSGGLELSMGMSADLEVAICAGSNNVRVGTDCFGVRPASRDEAMKGMEDELQAK